MTENKSASRPPSAGAAAQENAAVTGPWSEVCGEDDDAELIEQWPELAVALSANSTTGDAGQLAALIEADPAKHAALLVALRAHDERLLTDPLAWLNAASHQEVRAYRQAVIARFQNGERDYAAATSAFLAVRHTDLDLTDKQVITNWLASSGPGMHRVVKGVYAPQLLTDEVQLDPGSSAPPLCCGGAVERLDTPRNGP